MVISSALSSAATTPSGQTVNLAASSMTVTGLTFVGCVDGDLAASACATGAAMEFTLSSADLQALSESQPCHSMNGQSLGWSATSATASFPNPTTVYASSFTSDQYSWTAASPPGAELPLTGTLTTVKLAVLLVGSADFTAERSAAYAFLCASATSSPARQAPSVTPSTSPAAVPTASPSESPPQAGSPAPYPLPSPTVSPAPWGPEPSPWTSP